MAKKIPLPTMLTWFRIILVPFFVGVYYLPDSLLAMPNKNITATVIFLFAAITDYLDGYLARKMNLESKFGAFLDPVADKLLVSSTLLMLVGFEHIRGLSLIPAVIILCREILVSGLREFLSPLKVDLPVTNLAKWKTAVQMVALVFLILEKDDSLKSAYFCHITGNILLWIAGILTLVTGYAYLKVSLKYFSEEAGA